MASTTPRHGFWSTLLAADSPGRRLFWNGMTALLVGVVLLLLTWPAHLRYRRQVIDERLIDLEEAIDRYAELADLPPALVAAVVRCESGGDPLAHSRKDAKGLMQVTRHAETDALKDLGRKERGDLFDPEYNLLIGTTYLARLYRRFDGDLPLVVAAYHMGQSRVAALRVDHPGLDSMELIQTHPKVGPQTRAYTRQVVNLYEATVRE